MKEKGIVRVVSRKNNKCYIRFFDTEGLCFDLKDNLNNDLNVGDLVEYEHSSYSQDSRITKINPTQEDIAFIKQFQIFLDEVAKNAGIFFRDVLMYGRQKILENGKTEYDIVYNDEQINKLVEDYISSIRTYGVAGCSGYGLFGFMDQLMEHNLFNDKYVDYRKILGENTSEFSIDELPTCVPREISNNIDYDGDPLSIRVEYGDSYFSVELSEYGITTEPYTSGDFQNEMEMITSKCQK